VNDPQRVGLGNGFAGLHHVAAGGLDGERTVLFQNLLQILPFEELHDHVGGAVLHLAHIGHLGNVFALDPASRLRFPQKPGVHILLTVLLPVLQEEFDGNPMVE
jgi:hypothetical protein